MIHIKSGDCSFLVCHDKGEAAIPARERANQTESSRERSHDESLICEREFCDINRSALVCDATELAV